MFRAFWTVAVLLLLASPLWAKGKAKERPKPSLEELLRDEGAIRCKAALECEVSEALRDLAIESPEVFASEGAAWPNVFGLPRPGFVITWLRPSSVFERLGLRVWDIVFEVNGMPLRSLEEATSAYYALRGEKVLKVRFQRGAEEKVLTIRFFGKKGGGGEGNPRRLQRRQRLP